MMVLLTIDAVLYLLMFSVGISVGMYRGLAAKIREYHLRGWYSLAGAIFGRLVGAEMGSVAFLSNLMREIFSYLIIPSIAPAGATSEDTTLPMMLKYTNDETVVLSVLN